MSAQPKEPLVSVIMANRNGAAYLDAAISSVLRQTLQAVELVIADDASTDGSLAIAQSAVARDNRVKLVQCARVSGPGAARNRALNAATGHYVAVVDADDVIHPRRLETLVDYAAATDAPLVADDLIHFSTSGAAPERLFGEAVFDTPTTVGVLDLLEDRFMGGPNRLGYIKPVIQRSALGDLRYNEDLPVGEDFDLLLRFAHHGHGLHILPEAFYLYRRHTASVSHRLAAPPARAMADALRAFKAKTAPHAPVLAKVLDGRIARMERTAREAEILDRLKARRLAAAFFRYVAAPDTTTGMARALIATTRTQWRMRKANPNPKRPLLLVTPDTELPAFPPSWDVLRVLPFDRMTHDARAEFVAQTADEHRPLVCLGALDNDVSGLIPAPERIHRYDAPTGDAPVVHVRMPTYKRPKMLRRALECLQSQTMPNWVCDVFDDDPDASFCGRLV
ncbi:MAG: glycosyltransferase family 2 protein [Pseudomonadota bacterium]